MLFFNSEEFLSYSFLKIYYLLLAVVDVGCCMQAFSGCGQGGYFSLCCTGFSLQWLLFFQSGLQ